jgi:hypothetical protein
MIASYPYFCETQKAAICKDGGNKRLACLDSNGSAALASPDLFPYFKPAAHLLPLFTPLKVVQN